VTITDSLGAGALSSYGGFAARAVLAARAGADLLLCAVTNVNDNTPTDGALALDGLAAALANRTLSRTTAEQAAAMIIRLRSNP
jgi:beta-N-acetylhexosaminidase